MLNFYLLPIFKVIRKENEELRSFIKVLKEEISSKENDLQALKIKLEEKTNKDLDFEQGPGESYVNGIHSFLDDV